MQVNQNHFLFRVALCLGLGGASLAGCGASQPTELPIEERPSGLMAGPAAEPSVAEPAPAEPPAAEPAPVVPAVPESAPADAEGDGDGSGEPAEGELSEEEVLRKAAEAIKKAAEAGKGATPEKAGGG